MTTYATAPLLTDGPPAVPPRYAGGPPVKPARRRRRAGILSAAAALVVAVAATAAAMITFTAPMTPAQHTVQVVPPNPVTYNSAEIQAAKDTACSAWDKAARSTALASKASAAALSQSWRSPESAAALATEKRVGMAAVAYLRTQIGAATPADVNSSLKEWMAAHIDQMHALNTRDWTEADQIQKRGNDLVDAVIAVCGLG